MRNNFILLAAAIAVASAGTGYSQELIQGPPVTGVCYAGQGINRIYIPPPSGFFSRTKGKHASVRIIYSGFPAEAIQAAGYAASIIESVLPEDSRVVISASWERITTPGVLANSSISGYAGGWSIDALNADAYYPVSLAEKIAGRDLNDSTQADIILRVNNSIAWYYGTDGNTDRTRYDLVTIMIHEICHGLGFFDSMNSNGSTGWYGIAGFPLIYDTFIEDFQGNRLTDTLSYQNHSAALHAALTGGSLFFTGPLLNALSPGLRARIYAPTKWDSGSSISHLDENSTMDPVDMLMTPFVQKGEAIHDPGKLTMSILGELGWINTRIVHSRPHDTESHIETLVISSSVKSDTAYDHSGPGMVYSFDDFASRDTVYLSSPSGTDDYSVSVSVPSYNSRLSYHFFVRDTFGRLYRSPSRPASTWYSVFVGTDTSDPVIQHTPLTRLLNKADTLIVEATVTDNLGLEAVRTEYRHNDGTLVTVPMTAAGPDRYRAVIATAGMGLRGGDSLLYRIVATDSSRSANTAFFPSEGYCVVHIEGLLSVVSSYSTDFTGSADQEFINDGFSVSEPPGFSVYGLNSRHPYESPEDDNRSIEYTSILRHPVKLSSSGLTISYDEVVLVEPGEPGAVFGSGSFYDYVIAEGSADYGKSWVILRDGYDSGFRIEWKTLYNSSVEGLNSSAVPDEADLRHHAFYTAVSPALDAGDTVLVRFRLYSDPFAHGWGWFFTNLKINPLADAIGETKSGSLYTAYPNPGKGFISLRFQDEQPDHGRLTRFSVYNSSGLLVLSSELSTAETSSIDLSGHPAGLYLIVLWRDDWILTIRYILAD